jgi:hypothetical protein
MQLRTILYLGALSTALAARPRLRRLARGRLPAKIRLVETPPHTLSTTPLAGAQTRPAIPVRLLPRHPARRAPARPRFHPVRAGRSSATRPPLVPELRETRPE